MTQITSFITPNNMVQLPAADASLTALNSFKVPTAFVSLCGSTAPFMSSLLYVAPYPTIQNIIKKRNVGDLPLLPYSSMVVNSFVWMVYGILKNESKIYTPNGFGCIMGLYYSLKYKQFSKPRATNLPGSMNQHITISVFLMTLTALCAGSLQQSVAIDFIGKMGVLLCIILFASPLSALKTIIATKSARSIPLPFTLACMMNCFLWTTVGVLEMNDFNVYFPNILGLTSSLVQIFLKLLYGNGKGNIEEFEELLMNEDSTEV